MSDKKRTLHVLSPVTDPDVEVEGTIKLTADCGHECYASVRTAKIMLDSSVDHVVTCLPCSELIKEPT